MAWPPGRCLSRLSSASPQATVHTAEMPSRARRRKHSSNPSSTTSFPLRGCEIIKTRLTKHDILIFRVGFTCEIRYLVSPEIDLFTSSSRGNALPGRSASPRRKLLQHKMSWRYGDANRQEFSHREADGKILLDEVLLVPHRTLPQTPHSPYKPSPPPAAKPLRPSVRGVRDDAKRRHEIADGYC